MTSFAGLLHRALDEGTKLVPPHEVQVCAAALNRAIVRAAEVGVSVTLDLVDATPPGAGTYREIVRPILSHSHTNGDHDVEA